MSFFRRDHPVESSTITVIRDVVEILAILAAGIWAFYTFVYENRIKPASLSPDVTISGSMQRLGVTHGLEAIRLVTTSHNVGTMPIKFLAFGVVVTASTIVETKKPNYLEHSEVTDSFARHYRLTNSTIVYRNMRLTHDADSRAGAGLSQQPGSSASTEYVFYVPVHKYDRLVADYVARITRYDSRDVETTLKIDGNGYPQLGGSAAGAQYTDNDRITLATLALTGR